MKVKNLTIHQIIGISRRIPVSNFNQAVEIAKVFHKKILHTSLKASTSMIFGKCLQQFGVVAILQVCRRNEIAATAPSRIQRLAKLKTGLQIVVLSQNDLKKS